MKKHDILKDIIGAMGNAVKEMEKEKIVVGKVKNASVRKLDWAQKEALEAKEAAQKEYNEVMKAYAEKMAAEIEAKHEPNLSNAADKLKEAWENVYDEMGISESDREERCIIDHKTHEFIIYK